MLFIHTFDFVMSGEKTQTRRRVEESDTMATHGGEIVTVYRNGRRIYSVGDTLAVQRGRGKAAEGRIRLTAIRRQRVQEIAHDDAVAECSLKVPIDFTINGEKVIGHVFDPCYAFAVIWNHIHGKDAWKRNDEVWALSFEVVKPEKE